SARDLSVAIELVNGSEQKGLMQHRRQQGIGHAMSGDVDQRDPALVLTSLEVLDNVQPAFGTRTVDACLEIEPRLEVEVGDVVAADGSAHLERAAPDVKAHESGDIPWKRDQLLRNGLEILQLTGEPLQLVSGVRFVDEHVFPGSRLCGWPLGTLVFGTPPVLRGPPCPESPKHKRAAE